jgi:hypothetical protein
MREAREKRESVLPCSAILVRASADHYGTGGAGSRLTTARRRSEDDDNERLDMDRASFVLVGWPFCFALVHAQIRSAHDVMNFDLSLRQLAQA